MPASATESDTKSFNSSLSNRSFFGKLAKYELKRKFYEKLEDFKGKTLLYKEPGFVVYRARCAYSSAVVVLKGYARDSLTLQTRQRIWVEVNMLQSAHCPFILKCFDSFEDQGWWWLVLENCANGDLFRIMQTQAGVKEEGWLVSQVLLPLLQTLAYLHNEGIIHRDLKPEHILFNSEKVAKLSGFLLAQDVTKYGFPKDMVGSLDYVAPEVFRLNSQEQQALAKVGQALSTYDYKADIWMLGVLTYDVLVGRPPFNCDSPNDTVQRILLTDPEFPEEVSDDAADFILCCLSKEPDERPTARQLLSHPWVRNNIGWVPPPGFQDPVPDVDLSFYNTGDDQDNEDPDATVQEEEEGEGGRVWFNPATWLRRGPDSGQLRAMPPWRSS
ncbi:kinase-like domain-containing protein [Haematococcus lacustris]